MSLLTLETSLVEEIHDDVLNPGELRGRARDKSLEGALARVENRLAYGMIEDAFDLAAMYAVATGRCFDDGSKRTAFRAMQIALHLNDIGVAWTDEEVGPVMVQVAQGRMDEGALAAWLRGKAGAG